MTVKLENTNTKAGQQSYSAIVIKNVPTRQVKNKGCVTISATMSTLSIASARKCLDARLMNS